MVSYLTLSHIISGLLVLASTAILANKLGPSLYGEFSFMDSVLFVAILISSLGTEYIGNREVARGENTEEVVNGIFLLRTGCSLLIYILLMLWVSVYIQSASLRSLLYVCSSIVLTVPGIAGWYFLARQEIKIVAISTVLRDLLFFIAVALLSGYEGSSEDKLFYAGVFYSVSRFIFSGVFLLTMLKTHKFHFSVRSLTYRHIIKDSFALLYASLVTTIMINMPIYILKYFDKVYYLGIYGAFFKQIFYIQLISLSFIMIFFPLLSKAWTEDRQRYEKLAKSLSEMTLFVMLPIALTGILNADYLIKTIFSSEFQNGRLTLQILCLSLIPMGFGRVLATAFLITMNKTQKMYTIANITSIFSLVSGVLLIKNFPQPDVGAALSTLLTDIVFLAIAYYMTSRRLKLFDNRMFYCLIPAVTGMVLVNLISPMHLVGIITGIIVFIAIYIYIIFRWRHESLKKIINMEY